MLGDTHPEVYNDVTVGYHGVAVVKNNRCSGVCLDALDCVINGERQGLTAAPGWDAVTGFGSINFERMIRYVLPGNDVVSTASLVRSGIVNKTVAAAAAAADAGAAAAAATSAAAKASERADVSRIIASITSFPLLSVGHHIDCCRL